MSPLPKRLLALGLPLAAAAGAVALMIANPSEPPRAETVEQARPLRVLELAELPFVPRAQGFGEARPHNTWRAVARVPGRLVEVHPDLRAGSRVRTGELLVRIDDADVRLAIAAAEADVARLQAELTQLDVEVANDEASLAIERDIEQVATQELERIRGLVAKDAAAAADLESRQRSLLGQRQVVLSIESRLALVPARRAALEAQLAGARASLESSRRDLEHCRIVAPFDGVLGQVDLEVGQYVGQQEQLVDLATDELLRIDAAIPASQAYGLLDERTRRTLVAAINDPEGRAELLSSLFDVTVSTRSGLLQRTWEGRAVGAREELDTSTRSVLLTVLVEQDLQAALGGDGTPLHAGTFCQVELRGNPRQALVVPRSALRGEVLFWLDEDSRLRRSTVTVQGLQGEAALVATDLAPGTLLVVSDPTPAADGLLVEPVPDDALRARLLADAGP